MSDEIFKKLKDFVEKQQSWEKYDFPLERTTKVELDLGITGEDAMEFIIAYGEQFNVDVSRFMAADYFDAEGHSLFSLGNQRNKKILTLGDLEKGISAGRLDEKIINLPM
ncbi:MAG: DUF1493 family protein [Chitinophagaceae bacterium]|nr:DUF1493 family protein [Chitinophagaceae bacterium]